MTTDVATNAVHYADALETERSLDSLVRASKLGRLDAALASVDQLTCAQEDLDGLHRVFDAYPYPGLVVREDGSILVTNGPASSVFNVSAGQSIDDAEIVPLESPNLISALKTLKAQRSGAAQTHFVRALIDEEQRPVSIAIIVLEQQSNAQAMFLIFLIDIAWNTLLRAQLSQTFRLTPSEQDIMERFVSGQSLQTIAEIKERSRNTIRTQFYSVLTKFGVSTQAELVQEVFKVASFSTESKGMREKLRHPYRRTVSVLRRGGRCVDVSLVGKATGRPVLLLTSFGIWCPTPDVERAIYDNDILQVIVSPPGTGKTSPPEAEECYFDCMADDVEAVLAQLCVDSLPLIGTSPNFRMGIAIANRRPGVLSHIVMDVPLLPSQFMRTGSQGNPSAIHKALSVVSLKRMAIRTLARLFVRSAMVTGIPRFMQFLMRGYAEPDGILYDPDFMESLEEGFLKYVSQSIEVMVVDYDRALMDWEEEIRNADVPITVFEPIHNPALPRGTLRAFAENFGTKIQYFGISDTRALFIRGYPEAYVELLEGCISMNIDPDRIQEKLNT